MTVDINTVANAIADCITIDNVVNGSAVLNGDGTTTNRLGVKIKTLARLQADIIGNFAIVTATILATETLNANDFVNVYVSGGNLRVRKAIANDPNKFATGFVTSAIANSSSGLVSFVGINPISLSVTNTNVFLSGTVAGSYTLTPPTTSGYILQPLGVAMPGVGILFTPEDRVLL